MRTDIAIELYAGGLISIGKLAEIADLTYEETKKLLHEKGVKINRGANSVLEMEKEVSEFSNSVMEKSCQSELP